MGLSRRQGISGAGIYGSATKTKKEREIESSKREKGRVGGGVSNKEEREAAV